jgi:hypothetical protein
MEMKTQRQRSQERKKRDLQDSIRAAERANSHCERCGKFTLYIAGTPFNPSNHHDYRKNNYPELRHNPENHHYLCHDCHQWAHENVQASYLVLAEIRRKRGDILPLHPRAEL